MYKRINELLEICNIIFLLHCFRGKKIKIDIYEVMLILANIVIFELVNSYEVDGIVVSIVYLLIVIYSLVIFEKNLKRVLFSNMLYIIVLGIIQLAVGIGVLLLPFSFLEGDVLAITINASTLIIICVCRRLLERFFSVVVEHSKSIFIVIMFYFCFMVL